MNITLNGEAREFEDGTTVAGVVEAITHDQTRVAVERNLKIAPRAAWNETVLEDGDVIEIVTLVGGG